MCKLFGGNDAEREFHVKLLAKLYIDKIKYG
jgi:hypothetical protein